MSDIDFYFSIGSTYTYLSVTRILDVEKKHQVKFNWKPFSVRAIMKEMNNIPFPKEKMNKVKPSALFAKLFEVTPNKTAIPRNKYEMARLI